MSQPIESFEDAYQALFTAAFCAALSIVRDRSVAEEVAAEASYRAAVRYQRIAPYASQWIVVVARNLALDQVRRNARSRRSHVSEIPGSGSDESSADRLDIQAALGRLPRRQQQVLILSYYAGLSQRESAEQLGISLGSVKRHSSRALTAMRRLVGTTDMNAPSAQGSSDRSQT